MIDVHFDVYSDTPEGKDPDDFIKQNGKEIFLNLLKSIKNGIGKAYHLKNFMKQCSLKSKKAQVIA